MATYAIVIGIETYDDPGVPKLTTPVANALQMAAWLLAKGGVTPDHLTLLLGPIPTPLAPAPAGLNATLTRLGSDSARFGLTLRRLDALGNLLPATRENIQKAIRAIPRGAPNGGERLYFYYAGHGLQTRITFSNEDAIVPLDYDKDVTRAISVSSIVRYFQSQTRPTISRLATCLRSACRFMKKMPGCCVACWRNKAAQVFGAATRLRPASFAA